jgi:hypothetical protein
MEIFLHPVIVFELLLGGVVGGCLRWPIFRVLSCLVVPVMFAFATAAYYGLFTESGESRGWALLAFIRLAPAGFVAYTVGVLIGYLLRRVQAHDT